MIDFPQKEEKILQFWEKNRIFEKSLKKKSSKGNFVFYEGPPTANGRPGIHHVLSRSIKDIICRYKTMRGYRVLRKAGWDTHGIPVELEVEKELGFKTKPDIEKYGIGKFIKKCKESVWKYKDEWGKITKRMGFWLDLDHPYITYENDYIESLWWIIKQIWNKGLFYQDYKVVPYCPRCGTTLSSHEVALGYKKVKEPAVYLKFKVKDAYLLVWTTTPWTLPANVAIAIKPDLTYVKVKFDDNYLILAKDRLEVLGIGYEVVEEFKGKDLLGLEYEPLYNFVKLEKKAHFVIAGDFVSAEEGTGLVHIAPAFGEDDMNVGKKNNLPILMTLDDEGKFTIGIWQGRFAKDADPEIIEDLKKRKILWKTEAYEHDYPFCWRCNSPLLYYATTSWFIKMKKIQDDLLKNNQEINWVPAHLKEGRFGEWLKDIKDWAFSRQRFWGTPLPIWQCEKCKEKIVIGRLEDLDRDKIKNNNYFILRHGEAYSNRENYVSSWPEKKKNSFTKKGEKQIKKIIPGLKKEKIDFIFSSDLTRCQETAEMVAKKINLKVIFDKRLREINTGIFNGKSIKEWNGYFAVKAEKFTKRAPEAENRRDVKKRMMDFIREIDKKYQNKNILIVSHEDPLLVLQGTINGFSEDKILKSESLRIGVGIYKKIEFRNYPFNEEGELDLHRPYIDEIKIQCRKCKGVASRVPEVADVWFDSGAMPFAQYHYPFENKKLQEEQYPADFIAEGMDQTRGWFYTLLAVSTLLGKGPSYKNVISHGLVLDEKGKKMSKSLGNIIDPWEVINKYGIDALRWYFYTVNQAGEPKLFALKDVEERFRKFISTLYNTLVFFLIYGDKKIAEIKPRKVGNVLDKWILSKLNNLIEETTEKLDKYDIIAATRAIELFVEDLSNWYVRRSRKRFSKFEDKKDYQMACQVLHSVILNLSKLVAPFIPFLAEYLYKELKPSFAKASEGKSVHLEDWPKADEKSINKELEEQMKRVREICSLALEKRARAKIKVRQPLAKLKIKNQNLKSELLDLIRDEVNVKEIIFDPKFKEEIELDTKITPELKEEGLVREFIRQIQEIRKKNGLVPKDKIIVYFSDMELEKTAEKNKELIKKQVIAKDLIFREKGKAIDIEKIK